MASNGLRLLWRWTLISNCRNLRDASLPFQNTAAMGRVRSIVHTLDSFGVCSWRHWKAECGQRRTFCVDYSEICRHWMFSKEMSYLVIFVRDKPLFDRLTFTIFIFKDINNERVFRMYPNLLISSSKISAWFTKYD